MNKQLLICLITVLFCFITSYGQQRKSKTVISSKPLDIRKVNFNDVNHNLTSSEVRDLELTNQDVEVNDIEFGDLNGDDNEEAVVQIAWSYGRLGGNGHGTWIDIYTIEKNKLKHLIRFKAEDSVESRSWKILEVTDSQLILKRCDADEEYNAFTAIIFYKLNGKSLKQVKKLRLNIDDFPC